MYVFVSLLLLVVTLVCIGMAYRISTLALYACRQPISHTPADYGLPCEVVTFPSKDGLLLKGWWISANRVSAHDEPVVVLLHPHFGNRHGLCVKQPIWPFRVTADLDLLLIARSFHQIGYSVLLFDFRSHGESP